MHAPIRLYNVEHPQIRSSQSDRGPPLGSQENRAIPEGHNGAAPDVEGGGDHSLQFTGLANADWANVSRQRKSRSGYLFTLGRGPVSYKSKQQTCVALSTLEAKYYSATCATKEGLHLRQLMGEIFDEPIDGTTTIRENNQSAIAY
jgi:hypothetical protein